MKIIIRTLCNKVFSLRLACRKFSSRSSQSNLPAELTAEDPMAVYSLVGHHGFDERFLGVDHFRVGGVSTGSPGKTSRRRCTWLPSTPTTIVHLSGSTAQAHTPDPPTKDDGARPRVAFHTLSRIMRPPISLRSATQ